jgi:dipeptidyl aminopeptidase/acylaminoacyl peptidase
MTVSKRAMTLEDFFRFKRVSDPQISPDGRMVVYVLTTVRSDSNETTSNLWLAHIDGGEARQLTSVEKSDHHPRWCPDGKHIVFDSDRSGQRQLWVIDVDGGEVRQLTTIATDASIGIWSPDGKWIAFVSAVYPEYSNKPYSESNELNRIRKERLEKSPVKTRIFTKLFHRHWDAYVGDKRQHLFVMPAAGGEPRDVTPGDRDAYPTSATFSLGDDFTFSPDSKYLVYTAAPEQAEAWSTKFDIYRVPIDGGREECLTDSNPAADGAPRFSPDGRLLAYRAQRRPGFEADRWEIMIMDADGSTPRSITADFDRSPNGFVWRDSESIYFTAEDKGTTPVFQVSLSDNRVARILEGHTNASLSSSGNCLTFIRHAMNQPPEVFFTSDNRELKNVSRANTGLLGELDLQRPTSITVPGAGGTPMQMWILNPPDFDPQKKWPLAYLVHGGPQAAWEDDWSFRWNAQIWAAQGYVVALPNPRGSTGFGQRYVDEVSRDWGGKAYEDLMAGIAWLERQPYIDSDRMAGAGASVGGYMMNWIAGHSTKFKTSITHCGIYNLESMYGTTEELWFVEWDFGGPPWENAASYRKYSPHVYAKNFKTPMLIIHNDLDFRVSVSEGYQLFTALQRLGVPSKFINFPDEGHWVVKPANSFCWHKEIFDWLGKYVPPGGR